MEQLTDAASPASRLHCDVYLSFGAEDMDEYKTFCKRLSDSLVSFEIRVSGNDEESTADDDDRIKLSERIDAIEDSAASIVIFSPSYAQSWRRLEELAKICACMKRLVIPVFYQVDPRDVRKQHGPNFEESFRKHEDRFGKQNAERWRKAMARAGSFAGFVFACSKEAELIHGIVESILTVLNNTPMKNASYLVGMDSRIKDVMKLLKVKSDDTTVLVLHGTGGVGKTTLAKALFNKLVGHFERKAFIENVRESAQNDGLTFLTRKLIEELSPSASVDAIKKIANVHKNPVLVVLDDVDNATQLDALARSKEWFYEGSKIIITARDFGFFPKHLVNDFYEVRELDPSQALQLFSLHALRSKVPTDQFLGLSKQIVSLAGQLPLALEVFGSFLCDKRMIGEWEDALVKLKKIRPGELQDVLKISFDGLKEDEKKVFLDIVCLLGKMEMKIEEAIDIWRGCGLEAEKLIKVLTRKSLIKIVGDDTFWVHDQVRDMGRQIVLQGTHRNLLEPGARSRLWDQEEIMNVLKYEKGTGSIEAIIFFVKKKLVRDLSGGRISWDSFKRNPTLSSLGIYLKETYKDYRESEAEKEEEIVICTKALEKMVNLRLLQINHVNLEGDYKLLPSKLKWLKWKGCPLRALPSDFFPSELGVLDLSESGIERLWNSSRFNSLFSRNKVGKNLIVMNFRGCYNLAALPDLSGLQALEKLILERCGKLSKLHKSIGSLCTLLHLNLKDCSNLTEITSDVSGLIQLETLNLSGCSKLKNLPDDIGSMRSLKELFADETSIGILPESICSLNELTKLSLRRCRFLKRLPECIGEVSSLIELFLYGSAVEEIPKTIGSLANLEKLDLMHCESLKVVHESVGNLISLKELLAYGSAIEEVPESVGSLTNLKNLSIGGSSFLRQLPDSIGGLGAITELAIEGTQITELPDQIGNLRTLKKLELRNLKTLGSLPESIGGIWSLITLNIYQANIEELPESIGKLENLVMLRLNKCQRLHKLPNSIGNLKSLHRLFMQETAVNQLPESFGMLTSLMVLDMGKKKPQEENEDVLLPASFSNLSSLYEFNARACKISGRISDDFEKLTSLETLKLGYNNFSSLPSSLEGLSFLETLLLPHCKNLKSLPSLPSSLVRLNVENCTALETIADISELKRLQELNLTNCEKVVDIPGLECLNSLKRLYLGDCITCSFVVRKRLSKVPLRNMRTLSMPGSKIPDWFSQDSIRFSNRKNYAIKAVIIGVVVSLTSHESCSDTIISTPAIVDIQAKILKLDMPIFTTVLYLLGVPNSNEDQIHLCRFPVYSPLVAQLKDGYHIYVDRRNPPFMKGVELKKYGIHLVYEGEDDYDGNEDSLDEKQLSLSEKLARFFTTYEE